jgi:hypothetical protein
MQSTNLEPNHFGNEWGLFIDIECANSEINYNKNKTQQKLYKITNLEVIYESSDDELEEESFCSEVIINNNFNNNNIKKKIQKCNKISLCLITICIIIIVIII